MRRNSFTSASDRRWQRRYERIQQRREEELERRDRQGRDEAYKTISIHDLGIDSVMASSTTFTVEIQRPDEPNLNGTVISKEAWDAAWPWLLQRAANESCRSLSEVVDDYIGGTIRFKNGGYLIIDDLVPDDLVPAFEPEPELMASDSAELDSFLGNFVAPGA